MSSLLQALEHEFRRHQSLADKGIAQLEGNLFFARPAPHVNSAAVIVKHLSGSMHSRWTNFLTSDGEKPDRDRDAEFAVGAETRAELLADWDRGWAALYEAMAGLTDADLERTVFIRNEPHTVLQALLRGLSHATYHVGQILYLARLANPEGEWLTIPPGKSKEPRLGYLATGKDGGDPTSP
jgi:uncharacterized damage-inducible protein DinB